jgi:hypothetical protein
MVPCCIASPTARLIGLQPPAVPSQEARLRGYNSCAISPCISWCLRLARGVCLPDALAIGLAEILPLARIDKLTKGVVIRSRGEQPVAQC